MSEAIQPSVEELLREDIKGLRLERAQDTEILRIIRSELRAANDRIADLSSQIDWKSKAKILTEGEAENIAAQRREWEAMNNEQNAIARFFRDHYGSEIASGAHSGRSLSSVVCQYLGELKALKAKQEPVQ